MGRKVRSLSHLELRCRTSGTLRGTYAILDAEDTIVLVMVGKPWDISAEAEREWDRQAERYASVVETLRAQDERPFRGEAGHHSRGDFAAVGFGFGHGNGRTV